MFEYETVESTTPVYQTLYVYDNEAFNNDFEEYILKDSCCQILLEVGKTVKSEELAVGIRLMGNTDLLLNDALKVLVKHIILSQPKYKRTSVANHIEKVVRETIAEEFLKQHEENHQ